MPLKLPTNEETIYGIKKAGIKVSHPCFPCKYAVSSGYEESDFLHCLHGHLSLVGSKCAKYWPEDLKQKENKDDNN